MKQNLVLGRIKAYYDADLKKENNNFCSMGFHSTISGVICGMPFTFTHGVDYIIDGDTLEITLPYYPSLHDTSDLDCEVTFSFVDSRDTKQISQTYTSNSLLV